jgi:predicted RNA methylase
MRTRQFIKGFELAIKAAKSKFKGETIKILYAGTGPFATLMLPMTTIFSSEEIQFTLIEINEVSIQHLEQVIDQFQVRPYVLDIIQADAATYELTNKGEHHMLITETMQRALKKEPQVGITLNLLPQIHKDGYLVPESINVNLALVDSKRDMARMAGDEDAEKDYYLKLGNIIEFDKCRALEIANAQKKGLVTQYFECAQIEFPKNVEPRFKHLQMMTEIQVYKEITLTHNQCSLNLYEPVKLNSNLETFPKVLSFEYELSDMPKIRWHA